MASKEKVYCIADEYRYIFEVLSKKRIDQDKWKPVYYDTMFSKYLQNVDRIASAYKADFFDFAKKTFIQAEKEGDFKRKFISNWKQDEFEDFIKDNFEEFIVKRINRLFLSEESIWIYGAGKIAKYFWNMLYEENKAKVKGFLVTRWDKDYFSSNQKVFLFNNVEIKYTDKIMIATNLRTAENIVDILKMKGISNYLVVREYI